MEELFRSLLEKRRSIAHGFHHIRQEGLINELIVVLCLRPVPENDCFSLLRVGGEHPPVDESTVPDIRIVDVFSGDSEEIADE